MNFDPFAALSSFSSSPSSVLMHTVTMSSSGSAERCVINIPVADCAEWPIDGGDDSAAAPIPLPQADTLSIVLPSASSSSYSSAPAASFASRVARPRSSSPSSSATSPRAPAPPPEAAPLPLTREQRQRRRKAQHRDIDATRREREAGALQDLEEALSRLDSAAPGSASDDFGGEWRPLLREEESPAAEEPAAQRPHKRPRSKAAVIATAAARITELQQSFAALQRQQRKCQAEDEQRRLLHALHGHGHGHEPHQQQSLAYASFFRLSPAQLILFSPTMRRCVDANEAFCAFTGYSRHELVQSRLALCPAHSSDPLLAEQRSGVAGGRRVEQWEVDATGRTVLVPREQAQWNGEQMALLFSGKRRRVVCVFRIALAGQRLAESQCECWLTGEPLTAPESCGTSDRPATRPITERLIVAQTSADKYRAVVCDGSAFPTVPYVI